MLQDPPTPLPISVRNGIRTGRGKSNGLPTTNQHEPPLTRSDRIIVIITDRNTGAVLYYGIEECAIRG